MDDRHRGPIGWMEIDKKKGGKTERHEENTQYTVTPPRGLLAKKNDKNGQYTLEEEMGNVAAFGRLWNFWVESVSFQKLYVLFFLLRFLAKRDDI